MRKTLCVGSVQYNFNAVSSLYKSVKLWGLRALPAPEYIQTFQVENLFTPHRPTDGQRFVSILWSWNILFQSLRDSCSSRESHKSSLSQRSSQEDAIETLRRAESPEDHHVRHSGSLKQKYCHIVAPGGDLEKTSCKTQGILSRHQRNSEESNQKTSGAVNEEIKSVKTRSSGSYGAVICKHELVSSPEEKDSRSTSVSAYPTMSTMSQLEKIIAKESAEFKAKYENKQSEKMETIKRRQETARTGEVWAEVKGRTSSFGDSAISPAYRSLRSLTPEEDPDDSTSFHESFEKELMRRRRIRRRSASCSSRCCESEGCRLESRSTHSVTGASSRNSSSRSEKSSTRSSRSPSIEHIKQGQYILCGPNHKTILSNLV